MNSPRALSTTLGYVLTLAITAVLVSGLLIAGGNFIEDQRERVIQTELEVIGEQVATQINAVDRLNQSAHGDRNVSIRQTLPSDVSGNSYRITLVERADPALRIETTRPDLSTEIELTNTTAVGQSSVSGGTVVVEYNSTEGVVIDDI